MRLQRPKRGTLGLGIAALPEHSEHCQELAREGMPMQRTEPKKSEQYYCHIIDSNGWAVVTGPFAARDLPPRGSESITTTAETLSLLQLYLFLSTPEK
jgi:hypothetical protein